MCIRDRTVGAGDIEQRFFFLGVNDFNLADDIRAGRGQGINHGVRGAGDNPPQQQPVEVFEEVARHERIQSPVVNHENRNFARNSQATPELNRIGSGPSFPVPLMELGTGPSSIRFWVCWG